MDIHARLKKLSGLLTLLFFLSPLIAFPQEITLTSGFLEDSIMIGDETPYYLTARYPASLTILFPDSSFNYHPFEFQRKQYFPTETNSGLSYDSVVYYLTTFEIDTLQSISLPVFVANPNDCTRIASRADSLLLNQLVLYYVDSFHAVNLPLRTNTAYEPVPKTFNYPLAAIILFVLSVLTIGAWLIFGEKIKRHWLIRRLQKKYNRFTADYSITLERFKADFSPSSAEAVVKVWKKYLEDLERIPFTKLTTKETAGILKDPAIEQPLRVIDRTIYGNTTATTEPFDHLRMFADRRFKKKLEELKNG